MKYETNCQFQKLDFHDSPVSKIVYGNDSISIYLDFANILAEHIANPYPVAKCIENCAITFNGVIESIASVYNDETKVFEEHQYPTEPLDQEILEVITSVGSKGLVTYTLKGFHSTGWTEWRITSQQFKLSWDDFSQDAWFVD